MKYCFNNVISLHLTRLVLRYSGYDYNIDFFFFVEYNCNAYICILSEHYLNDYMWRQRHLIKGYDYY